MFDDDSEYTEVETFERERKRLNRAIRTECLVLFQYQTPDGVARMRLLQPQGFERYAHSHPYGGGETLCVVGYDYLTEDDRTFALKRIRGLSLVPEDEHDDYVEQFEELAALRRSLRPSGRKSEAFAGFRRRLSELFSEACTLDELAYLPYTKAICANSLANSLLTLCERKPNGSSLYKELENRLDDLFGIEGELTFPRKRGEQIATRGLTIGELCKALESAEDRAFEREGKAGFFV